MEARKVQKTGTSTMTVSLPKDWVSANNIKAGDQVNVDVLSDGSLSIDPKLRRKKEPVKSVVMVKREESNDHLTRKLIGAYLAGYNVIEVRSKERMDLDTKHAVKDFARLVIGPEVIEETANSIVMHDLSDPVELPQKKCVRRMHLIVDSMHRDAMTAYNSKDAALARDVIDRDQDVDRLYWMTVKQFNLVQKDRSLAERIGVDIYESMSLMLVARILERVGDHAERIAKQAILVSEDGRSEAAVDDMQPISDKSLEALAKAIEAFFLHDIDTANPVIDRAQVLVQEADKFVPRLQGHLGKGTVNKTAILDSLTRTIMYATDIAEIAINDGMRLELKETK